MKIYRAGPQLVFTFDNRFSSSGWASITVCPVHIFPPPTELLVCYQPHRQEVMQGQKSIYETFLVGALNKLPDDGCQISRGRKRDISISCPPFYTFSCITPPSGISSPLFPFHFPFPIPHLLYLLLFLFRLFVSFFFLLLLKLPYPSVSAYRLVSVSCIPK
jgi:hypothetical protein